MTQKRLVQIDADTMQSIAHKYGYDIEIDNTLNVAFLTLDGLTFAADLGERP